MGGAVSDLKAIIMSHENGGSYVLDRDGGFRFVKSCASKPIGAEIEIKSQTTVNISRYAAFAACLVFVVLLSVFAILWNTESYSVYVDINPSVELLFNNLNKSKSAEPKNEDGAALLDGLRLTGTPEDVIIGLLLAAEQDGYLDPDSDSPSVLITITAKGRRSAESLKSILEAVLEQNNMLGMVVIEICDRNLRDRADELGVSPGRLILAERLFAANAGVSIEEILNMPIQTLMEAISGGTYTGSQAVISDSSGQQQGDNTIRSSGEPQNQGERPGARGGQSEDEDSDNSGDATRIDDADGDQDNEQDDAGAITSFDSDNGNRNQQGENGEREDQENVDENGDYNDGDNGDADDENDGNDENDGQGDERDSDQDRNDDEEDDDSSENRDDETNNEDDNDAEDDDSESDKDESDEDQDEENDSGKDGDKNENDDDDDNDDDNDNDNDDDNRNPQPYPGGSHGGGNGNTTPTTVYIVTFVDWDGSVLKTQNNIPRGAAATAPADPERRGYTFTGWDSSYRNVTGDITVTAVYVEKSSYTVIWSMGGGSLGDPSVTGRTGVRWTESSLLPVAAPEWDGHRFDGWLLISGTSTTPQAVENLAHAAPVNSDDTFASLADRFALDVDTLIVEAQWTGLYTVTFLDWNSSLLKAEQGVPHGTGATPPGDPVRQGYTFTGWDKDFSSVTGDLTVTAVYEINENVDTFTVTWNANGGALADPLAIGRFNVRWTDDNLIPEEAPTREGFRFDGWALTAGIRLVPLTFESLQTLVIVSAEETFAQLAEYFRIEVNTLVLTAQWTRTNDPDQEIGQ